MANQWISLGTSARGARLSGWPMMQRRIKTETNGTHWLLHSAISQLGLWSRREKRNKAEVGRLLAFLYLQLEPPTHCEGLTIVLIATSECPHKQLHSDIQIKGLPFCKRDGSMLMTLSFSSCISRWSGSQRCGCQCCHYESSSPIYPSKHSKYLQ